MTTWRTRIEPFTRPLFFAHARASRGMTLGVRGVAVRPGGQVLLVKHTCLHGWRLPGDGVERGQIAGATTAESSIVGLSLPPPKPSGFARTAYRTRGYRGRVSPQATAD